MTASYLDQIKHFNYRDTIINEKYTILYRIADEPHSIVYSLATKKRGKQLVRAIKLEHQNVQFPQISKEVAILTNIFTLNQHQVGFPRLYQFGSIENQNYMITKLLGPNIAQLHRLCNNRFNQQTCFMVGLQMLDRIQKIHQLGFVYRDIRLENFVIGLGYESSFIYMIDFGHCERFRNKDTGSHMPYKEGNSNIDDTNFMSVNIHNNVRYTRRDDIESLLYLIIFMFKSKLPWKKVEAKTKKQKDEKIGNIKRVVSPSYLSNHFGIQMADLLWYIRSVNFYQKPDYDFIRNKLYTMMMSKTEIKSGLQIKYDWNEREQMDYSIYSGQPKLFLNKNQVQEQQEENQHQIDQMLKTQLDEENSLL